MTADEEVTTRTRQLILAWSVKHAPDLASARQALQRSGVSGPIDDILGPHPDLLSWTSGGWVGPQLPMNEVDFHRRVEENTHSLVLELATYKDARLSPGGPRWFDAIALVERAVVAKPSDGLKLLDQPDLDADLLGAVVRAWQRSELDESMVATIVGALSAIDISQVTDDVARLLADGNGGSNKVSPWHRSTAARRLSLKAWSVSHDARPDSTDRWLDAAIGTTAGRIALYWVRVVEVDWSDNQEAWSGISEETKGAFGQLLSEPGYRSVMAEVILASQVHFLFRAERDWARADILPLLDWNDAERAARTWDGFLIWGRWEDALLDAGLFDAYMGAINGWEQLSANSQEGLCTHLAAIAIYSERDPRSWLPQFISGVSKEGRIEWARQIGRLLGQVSADTAEGEWNRWMNRYWNDRLASVPRALDVDEASEMATWIPPLDASIEAGVALAQRGPLGLGSHNELLRLLDDEHFRKAPAAFIRLIVHALESVDVPFWGGYHLQRIVAQARNHVTPETLAPLLEQAMRLGHTDAPSWTLPDT